MNHILATVTFSVLLAGPVLAESKPSFDKTPVGKIAVPNENVVIYSSPPTGVFAKPVPKAIFSTSSTGPVLFALKPTKDGKDYVTAAPLRNADTRLVVRDYRDIAQGKTINRWVELGVPQSDTTLGWALLRSTGQTNAPISLLPGDGS